MAYASRARIQEWLPILHVRVGCGHVWIVIESQLYAMGAKPKECDRPRRPWLGWEHFMLSGLWCTPACVCPIMCQRVRCSLPWLLVLWSAEQNKSTGKCSLQQHTGLFLVRTCWITPVIGVILSKSHKNIDILFNVYIYIYLYKITYTNILFRGEFFVQYIDVNCILMLYIYICVWYCFPGFLSAAAVTSIKNLLRAASKAFFGTYSGYSSSLSSSDGDSTSAMLTLGL